MARWQMMMRVLNEVTVAKGVLAAIMHFAADGVC